jgi:hypothetical protein
MTVTRMELRAERIATEKLIAGRAGRPYPDRITAALDMRGLDGPEVDVACGAAEPAVDRWEAGQEVPSRRQVELLADLTGFPVAWFFTKPTKLVLTGWICGADGCEQFDERPDADIVPLRQGAL